MTVCMACQAQASAPPCITLSQAYILGLADALLTRPARRGLIVKTLCEEHALQLRQIAAIYDEEPVPDVCP